MATPHLSANEAKSYEGLGAGVSDVRVEITLGLAADAVESLAPPPDTASSDYDARARRCEAALFSFGWSTQWGSLEKRSAGDVSRTFTDSSEVRRIVGDAMGPFYTEPIESGSVAYVEPVPWR